MDVHARNRDDKAKINIETAEVVENNGLKPVDLKKAVDAIRQYKDGMIKAQPPIGSILLNATDEQRAKYEIGLEGNDLHWGEIDEETWRSHGGSICAAFFD